MGRIRLTSKGVSLLEKGILEAFIENPEETMKAAETVGINLNNIFQKYLQKYLEIEEDLSRISLGMKPKYNSRGHYSLK